MPPRPILTYPDPMLATAAAPVGAITEEIRAIWDDMVATMDAMPGVGLAAPQIGVGLCLCVVDASDARGQALRMADPAIVPAPGARIVKGPEASPCLPGLQAHIARHDAVMVTFTDAAGERVTHRLEGLWAVSAQHQLDHLEGRLILDRLSRTRRDMALRKYHKLKG